MWELKWIGGSGSRRSWAWYVCLPTPQTTQPELRNFPPLSQLSILSCFKIPISDKAGSPAEEQRKGSWYSPTAKTRLTSDNFKLQKFLHYVHQSFCYIKPTFFVGNMWNYNKPFKDKFGFQLKDGKLHSSQYIYSVPATKSNCKVSSIYWNLKTCFHEQ